VLPGGIKHATALATAAADSPGVTLVDKAGSVSRVLARYRADFSLGLAVAVLLVWAVLARRYGWRHGAGALLPALLGMALALAAHGYTHTPVTLFSVMALLLVLCIGGNYAVFLIEGRGREGITLIAVALSAATTLLSFGLLAFSSMPALAHFGATLLCGIAAAVLFSPLALVLRGATPAAP
jgi:predicted exporter